MPTLFWLKFENLNRTRSARDTSFTRPCTPRTFASLSRCTFVLSRTAAKLIMFALEPESMTNNLAGPSLTNVGIIR